MPSPQFVQFKERLIGPKELETALTLQYTVPPGQGRVIVAIYLTSDSNARTINFYIVPVGQTPQNGYKLLDNFSTIANDLRPVTDLEYPLRVGETIYTSTSGSGVKITVVAKLNI